MAVPPTTASPMLRRDLRIRRQTIAMEKSFWRREAPSPFEMIIENAFAVGLYLPSGGEPDPFSLLAAGSKVTSLPHVEPDRSMMSFRRWNPGDATSGTAFGVRQPLSTASPVEPDLILVPLLAFDEAFNRIGQGGGYYDRYLAAHPRALRIGIAWEGQRLDSIAAQPWDVAMDAILTETAFYMGDLDRCQRL